MLPKGEPVCYPDCGRKWDRSHPPRPTASREGQVEQEPALQALERNGPARPFRLEAGANGVLAVRPGNLVRNLHLVSRADAGGQGSEHVERPGDDRGGQLAARWER